MPRPMNQSFGTGVGPILLNDVTCNQSHSSLLQCVHPQDIGIHDCDRENVAGVICPNVSTITAAAAATTNISPNITSTEITFQNTSTLFIMNSSLVMTSTSSLVMTSTSSLDMFATNTQ